APLGFAPSSFAFLPSGKALAIGGEDGAVRVWDLVTRQVRQPLRGPLGRALCLGFTPTGDGLVSGGDDGRLRFWDWVGGAARGGRAGQGPGQRPPGPGQRLPLGPAGLAAAPPAARRAGPPDRRRAGGLSRPVPLAAVPVEPAVRHGVPRPGVGLGGARRPLAR